MAKKRGTGSVIRVKRLSGVGALRNPNSAVGAAMPVVLGGGVAALTMIGIRQFMTPTSDTQMAIVKNAPWVGLGAGGLVSLAMWNMSSRAAGISGLAAASVVGLGVVIGEYAAKMRMAPAAGVGAVVPEYSMAGARRGTGAIVMEPHASRGYGAGPLGSYGEEVNLGAINPKVFGTTGFNLGYGGYSGRMYG